MIKKPSRPGEEDKTEVHLHHYTSLIQQRLYMNKRRFRIIDSGDQNTAGLIQVLSRITVKFSQTMCNFETACGNRSSRDKV